MKIAATYANGEIFQHFGHTQQFKVYEVEDGIGFFDAVRKASAEFVNTPDGRKIYYKKGSFS